MLKKKKIFGIISAVLQAGALVFAFLPYVFNLSQYSFNPMTGKFEFDKTLKLFNIFFNPGAVRLTEAVSPMPTKGLWTVFALLFAVSAAATLVLLILGLIKKHISKLTVLTSALALVFIVLTGAFVLNFSCEVQLWQYMGRFQYGLILFFALQLLAVIFSAVGTKKEKIKPETKEEATESAVSQE